MNIGQVDAALMVYARKGDWDTCLAQAQREGDQYVEKYTMMYAQDLVNKERHSEAVSVLAKYSPSGKSTNIPAYIALCRATVYGVPSYDVIQPAFYALRQMLFKVLRNSQPSAVGFLQLQNFTRAVHLLCQQASCVKYGLTVQGAKASLSLVRYCDVIPADFVFFKAGEAMESEGNADAAVLFYNSFIDISEVIKSGDLSNSSQIDHMAYEQTDVPREMCLRKATSVSDSVAERVTQWVIEQTVNSGQDSAPTLPRGQCLKCGKPIFNASLACSLCRTTFEFCAITGFPVSNPTRCTACGVMANRPDWGVFIAKAGRCPCCDAPQTAGA